MRHTKEFKRIDGSTTRVIITVHGYYSDSDLKYETMCATKGYRKQKWIYATSVSDAISDGIVTDKEILSVKMELWKKLKPF